MSELIDDCRHLDETVQRRWREAMAEIDVFAATAADALDGLAERVSIYADGFPHHLGVSNYSAATTLHSTLRSLASGLSELANLSSRCQDRG